VPFPPELGAPTYAQRCDMFSIQRMSADVGHMCGESACGTDMGCMCGESHGIGSKHKKEECRAVSMCVHGQLGARWARQDWESAHTSTRALAAVSLETR
jgi:hypothetical protein